MPSNTQQGGQPQLWAQDFAYTNFSTTTNTGTGVKSVVPDVTIQANWMNPGDEMRCLIYGKGSTASASPGTLTWSVLWGGTGGTQLAASSALTLVTSASNACWNLEYQIICTAVGSLFVQGWFRCKATLVASPAHFPIPDSAPAVTSGLTFSANEALTFAMSLSSASASNTFTSDVYTLESWGS